MPAPRPQDLTVDLMAREVRHTSGTTFGVLDYESPGLWLAADHVKIRNEQLLPGDPALFAQAAKGAAIEAWMKHRRGG